MFFITLYVQFKNYLTYETQGYPYKSCKNANDVVPTEHLSLINICPF